jgi:hypothetical protein
MERKLIEAGVHNLKEFGYPAVTSKNILTDEVYSQFFKRMLEETKEEQKQNTSLVMACEILIARIVERGIQ